MAKMFGTCPTCGKYFSFEATPKINRHPAAASQKPAMNIEITKRNCACPRTDLELELVAEEVINPTIQAPMQHLAYTH